VTVDTKRDERVVGNLLRHWAETRPHDRFVTCGEQSFTYAELEARATAVAAGFAALGVAKGDRVAILSPNRMEMVDMYFGLAKLGAIQVPLNAFLKGEFLRYQLADSQASVLVVDADGHAAVTPLLDQLPDLRTLVLLDDRPSLHRAGVTEVALTSAILAGSAPLNSQEISREDTMSVLYTSGTTGFPKGCVLSHGYYTRVAKVMDESLGFADDDSLYTALPLFHAAARMMVLGAALRRGIPVTVDPAFSPTGILPRCKEVGATIIIGMGVMGTAMLSVPERPEDRDHRVHTMSMAPLTPENQARFQERFGIDPYVEMFGQTECVPVLASKRLGVRNRASCGQPADDLEVALLDDHGHPVSPGQVGEICLRPRDRYAMFDGYWNNPQAALSQIRGLWYHTGDHGRALPDGTVTFTDRKKDSLRRRGENVSSMELEAAILTHPKIAEAAVHAVPSELGEDDIKACLVREPDAKIEPGDLFGFFGEHLPYYAIPRYVEFVEQLPRNAVGRVMKHKLRDMPLTASVWDFEKLGLTVKRDERRRGAASVSPGRPAC